MHLASFNFDDLARDPLTQYTICYIGVLLKIIQIAKFKPSPKFPLYGTIHVEVFIYFGVLFIILRLFTSDPLLSSSTQSV